MLSWPLQSSFLFWPFEIFFNFCPTLPRLLHFNFSLRNPSKNSQNLIYFTAIIIGKVDISGACQCIVPLVNGKFHLFSCLVDFDFELELSGNFLGVVLFLLENAVEVGGNRRAFNGL